MVTKFLDDLTIDEKIKKKPDRDLLEFIAAQAIKNAEQIEGNSADIKHIKENCPICTGGSIITKKHLAIQAVIGGPAAGIVIWLIYMLADKMGYFLK